MTDLEGVFTFVNPQFERVYGYTAAEVVGKTTPRLIKGGTEPAEHYEQFWREILSGRVARRTFVNRTRSGGLIDVEATANPVHGSSGEVVGFLAVQRDVTVRLRTDEALRQSEERYRTLFEGAAEGILVARLADKAFTYANPAMCRMLGYTEPELRRMRVGDIHPAEDLEWIVSEFESLARAEKTLAASVPCLRKDGSRIFADVHASPAVVDGEPCSVGFFVDVTQHQQAEEKLRRASDLLNASQALARVGGWELDVVNDTLFWTDETYRIHDTVPGEFFPTVASAISFYAPESVPVISAAVRDAIDHGNDFDLELELITAKGRRIWVHATSAVKAEQGRTMKITGAFQDITERRLAQVALKRADDDVRRMRAALETSNDIVFLTDRQGVFTFVNPAFTKLYGYSADEVIGKATSQILKADDTSARRYELIRNRLLSGGAATGEWINKTKDGRLVDVEVSVSSVVDESGAFVGLLTLQRDVTERKLLESQLRQAQKMEAIGQLAGGIAHDFNNVLTAILGYSELLLERVRSDPGLSADLEEIRAAGERAKRLTRQLLAFSRKQNLVPQILDLNKVVTDIEKMLRRVIAESIRLDWRPEPALAHVKADPGQIEQIVMNLAVNSSDAMTGGGVLTIRTADVVLTATDLRAHPDLAPGPYVALSVEDTGSGIPPEVLEHVFEPFFTTKPAGRGTGLGLSTVHGIVKQSGGLVSIESRMGIGTAVTCCFPKSTETSMRPAAGVSPGNLRGSETVLIAEDQVAVRELMARVLGDLGYKILKARDGLEAIAIESAYQGPVDLLLSDVVMPGLNGSDLAQRLVQRRPDLRVLFVSGFTHQLAVHQGQLGSRAGFLQKPFTPEQLARHVRECLDRRMTSPPGTSA